MKDLIVAVGCMDSGLTPPMPFVGRRYDGGECAGQARLLLESALLRCGFDISDRPLPVTESQEIIMQANRSGADCIVVLSCGAFGSRKSFNDVKGGAVKYSIGRHASKSRELAEDVCAKLAGVKPCATGMCGHEWNGSFCPVIVVEMGYLTNFDEAKLLFDPDYIRNVAEYATMGICEYFGMPYIPHSPAAYKQFHARIGMRGKSIKLLQAALCFNGYKINIDGVYDKNTDVAVKEFSINNGVRPDDTCEDILNNIFSVAPTELSAGAKHKNVLYLQRKLNAKLYTSPSSGELDGDTIAALNEYLTETENSHLIAADGVTKQALQLLSEIGGGRPRLF